ncbi:PREDICTED: uncharacterized protein LOC108568516 [Nicrophorus vespilloides]|uniref:Uncharacterized protein LOC108568516 n=1 Tax=Nicrophorus vespilloides TaxID=110193 RepID=A0ABM1NEA5_NICVS|nr:PREDICTED: uncharacterized protein LOC108568516 [Nicrophorus vespilloides]
MNDQVEDILVKLGEDAEKTKNCLKLLEEWMQKTDYMPKNYDGRILLPYLRSCKYNLEKTKRKLENYFITKATLPDLFLNPNVNRDSVDKVESVINIGTTNSLTPDGFRISFVRFNSNRPVDYNFEDIARYLLFFVQLDHIKGIARLGDILVFDVINFVPGFIPMIFHNFLKPLIKLAEDGLPTNIETVLIINGSTVVAKIINTLKNFVKEKNKHRVHVHTSHTPLLDLFPSDMIPSNYEGTCGKSLEEMFDEIKTEINSHADYIKSQEEVRCSSIPKKYASVSLAGEEMVQGSFRKLEID